jgi:hypothetical protein
MQERYGVDFDAIQISVMMQLCSPIIQKKEE